MSLSIISANQSANIQIKEKLQKCFAHKKIVEYFDIESYNKHLDSFHTDNYETFYFEEYRKNLELVIIITEHSKRKMPKMILKNRYIPIKIVTINPKKGFNQQLIHKEIHKKINSDYTWIQDEFLVKYRTLLKQKHINFENFSENVKECPLCKNGSFIYEHNYSEDDEDYRLGVKCKTCTIILEYKYFASMMDASYVYNPKIEFLLDKYVKTHPLKKSIMHAVHEELERTETVGFLGCQ
jgi:hypothetical protein